MQNKFFGYLVVATVAVVAVLFTACDKGKVKKDVFGGYAQKGPFVAGSSVTISELKVDLTQTGKTYYTTISDNSGSFELTDIEFVSNYVQLKVDGHYFHEIAGYEFPPITLYAVVDIQDVNSANVNILTHLEKPRVEYLVKQEKKSFSEAKQQAQQEVLAIFGFTLSNTTSEALDLTNNGMLLAISSILAATGDDSGGLIQSQMVELMANISENIKTDGILDNTFLGTKLINKALWLSSDNWVEQTLAKIRNNMETRYAELGLNVTIPDFESYVRAFANSNLYPQ
jgi:gas vesicle protein